MISRKYIRHKKVEKVNSKIKAVVIFTLVTIILTAVFVLPVIYKAAEYQGKMLVTKILSDTVNEVILSEDVAYDNIIKIVRDKDNNITSIDTDINTVNKIKTSLATSVSEAFNLTKSHSYKMPLGTLFGNAFFVGRGPSIEMSILPMGYLNSTIESEFSSAGINQTNHKITLNVSVDYTIILPFHRAKSTLDTNLMIADIIIVGEVPEYYTDINGKNSIDTGSSR